MTQRARERMRMRVSVLLPSLTAKGNCTDKPLWAVEGIYMMWKDTDPVSPKEEATMQLPVMCMQ